MDAVNEDIKVAGITVEDTEDRVRVREKPKGKEEDWQPFTYNSFSHLLQLFLTKVFVESISDKT